MITPASDVFPPSRETGTCWNQRGLSLDSVRTTTACIYRKGIFLHLYHPQIHFVDYCGRLCHTNFSGGRICSIQFNQRVRHQPLFPLRDADESSCQIHSNGKRRHCVVSGYIYNPIEFMIESVCSPPL